jgi:monoamine oxidase
MSCVRPDIKFKFPKFCERAGGRCGRLCGDRYTELGGATQNCQFDRDLYFNPGPWRIPYRHRRLLDDCKRFGVGLESLVHVDNNAYLHAKDALGGKPQRFRHVEADFHRSIGEILAKAVNKGGIDRRHP